MVGDGSTSPQHICGGSTRTVPWVRGEGGVKNGMRSGVRGEGEWGGEEW